MAAHSVPTLYRMRRDGLIEFTKSGSLVEAQPGDDEDDCLAEGVGAITEDH